MSYIGITYPHFLANKLTWWLWERFMCKHNKHLLDEVWSIWGVPGDPQHYLFCDACGLEIHIKRVDTLWV